MLERTQRILRWYLSEWCEPGNADFPAKPSDIAEADAVCQELTGRALPGDVAELWGITDGFDCNGYQFYAVRQRAEPAFRWGFIERNHELDPLEDSIYVGSAGDEEMVLHLPSGRIDFFDPWGAETRPMFDSLDEMVYALLPAGIEE